METQKIFQEVGGRQNLADLRVSVAVALVLETQETLIAEEKDMARFAEFLASSDRIVSYNGKRFDLQVIEPYCTPSQFNSIKEKPHYDILERFKMDHGYRVGLDDLAKETLGIECHHDGLDAIMWFRQGKIKEVAEYCRQDVEMTAKLFERIAKRQPLYFQSRVSGKTEWKPGLEW